MNAKTKAILEFMKANLHEELLISGLARSVGISHSRLCYLFKTQIGIPPNQYLKTLRLEKACELLATTFLSIKQIRVKVGFKDESHFLRDFKKTYGLTPSAYRERNLDQILAKDDLAKPTRKSASKQ